MNTVLLQAGAWMQASGPLRALALAEFKRNPDSAPTEAASEVKRLATAMNGAVEAQTAVKTGDTDGLAFRLTSTQKMERAFMITKSSILGGASGHWCAAPPRQRTLRTITRRASAYSIRCGGRTD